MNDVRAGAPPAQSLASRLKGAAPLGAAGLAVVAGLMTASLVVNGDGSAPAAVAAGGAEIAPPVSSSAPSSAATPTAPEAPAPQPGSATPGVAFDQTPGAVRPRMSMEIVVKFKDDAKVKGIVDSFWRDPADARQRFDAFKAGKPEFAGLKLDRVTYSSELVLIDADGGGGDARLPAMREIAARLSAAPDIAYAEPNMTAHPGGQ